MLGASWSVDGSFADVVVDEGALPRQARPALRMKLYQEHSRIWGKRGARQLPNDPIWPRGEYIKSNLWSMREKTSLAWHTKPLKPRNPCANPPLDPLQGTTLTRNPIKPQTQHKIAGKGSAMAVEFEIMQHARMTLARSPPEGIGFTQGFPEFGVRGLGL